MIKEIKYFDIHSHLHFPVFENPNKKIEENLNDGVYFLLIGTCKKTSESLVNYLKEGVWGGIGLHPHHTWTDFEDEFEGKVEKEENFDEKFYQEILDKEKDKIRVIGEFGLDYFYFNGLSENEINEIKKRQWIVCEKQIIFAKKNNKSLMIHLRSKDQSAFYDFYDIVKNYLPLKVNIHFYSGDIEITKKFLDFGFYFSFGGVITFKNANLQKELVKFIPLENIITETDSPYVSPEPFRGKINEPKNVKIVLKKISEIKNIEEEKLKEIIFFNALKYLNLV
jgi:TatD DNase family protein